jgi:trehalose/maltose hydrolase-like predicted phosphorylase
MGEKSLSKSFSLRAEAGKMYHLRTIASMVSEIYSRDPEQQAIRMAKWGELIGFSQLRRANQNIWSELWKSRVKVYGDEEAQKVLDASFFYLLSSTHPSSKTGLAPYGLSSYENYFGHIFSDMDEWMFLPVLITSPEAARAMMECRVNGLKAAKETAALFGYRGAQYAWEASPVDGTEITPSACPTGWAEQQVGVAIPIWEYCLATGDEIYMREKAWPILQEIARWIESSGEYSDRGFEFPVFFGEEKEIENVTNSAYAMSCKMAMINAIDCAKKIGYQAPQSWIKIADKIYIPIDHDKKAILPDSKIRDYPKSGMAAVVQYLYLHNIPLSDDYIKGSFDMDEQYRRNPLDKNLVVCGEEMPPFTCPVLAPLAAMYGERDVAAQIFRTSWEKIWLKPFGLFKERAADKYGCFYTTPGSLLMTAMFGFTGLRLGEENWCKYPVALPEGWKRIEIDRIWVRGKPKKLIALHGQLTQLLDIEK